jgi:hypothetical protein
LALYTREVSKLRRIIALAEALIAERSKSVDGRRAKNNGSNKRASGKRVRRTGKELVQFRKMLKAERKEGVSVAELARQHSISPAYIYLLP